MIYVHVPFCRSFCTYCDFYSETVCAEKENSAIGAYLSGLKEEIDSRRQEIALCGGTDTIYFGGGTPSVLPLDAIREIVSSLGPVPALSREFTVEVNPDDIVQKGEEYVRGLLSLGVNRVSMGVQSLSDDILRWMNRRHNARCAVEAFSLLRRCGVKNISVDVIFGVSQMTDETLASTLKELIEMRPEHISAYQLSIEEGSALAPMVKSGLYTEAGEEQCRRQYELVCSMLSAASYEHYEISNWALPGRRAIHNSAYWKRVPYVGLGPGAHSLIGHRRSWNSESLNRWTSDGEDLTPGQERCEAIMLGLRTADGIEGKKIAEKDWFIADTIISDYLLSLNI
ncbi:MAG: radical SAM family heme chaperone HemW [Bacteroidales bacterium]|nr:radical SAM family heme chaperone HemW [Bacteroidales bacterium]